MIIYTVDNAHIKPSQRKPPAETEGTLRAALLGKLLNAQASLVRTIERLQNDAGGAGLVSACNIQLAWLSELQGTVSSARPAELAAMSSAVSASIAVSMVAASQAASASNMAVSAQIAATSAAARGEVQSLQSDLFERRIFDAYLRFRSPEEEAAYRAREAENRTYIERQLAARTPEGDLNAAGATMGQMLDAHSHGAGASPEFQARWDRLEATTRKHRDALRKEGHSTEEFDRNLNVSVRRYLRDKGLTDAEIEAKLAVSESPLDAVKPYLKTEKDVQQLSQSSNLVARFLPSDQIKLATAVPVESKPSTHAAAPAAAPDAPGLVEVMASFKKAGVVPAGTPSGEAYSHGVDLQKLRSAAAFAQAQ